jgi:hypothetical protein
LRRKLSAGHVAAGAILAACAVYAAATWDAWFAAQYVRFMCDEDVPFVNERRKGVEAVAVSDSLVRRDPALVKALETRYPTVTRYVSRRPGDQISTRFEVAELWPTTIRSFGRFRIERSELSLVDLELRRILATGSLYRGVGRTDSSLDQWRARLSPEPIRCVASDRIEFVRDVLRPAE